jgi:hypothetical protein
MDPAGARALARRIEEHQALLREQAAEAERSTARSPVTATYAPVRAWPAPAHAPAAKTAPPDVEIVRLPARPAAEERDVRMYMREVRRERVDGREAVVTTIRCRTLHEGRWQSRVVDVIVDQLDSQG